MADYLPQNSGLWSTTTWITAFSNLTALAGGNTPPTVIDDVYADRKFITIDINTQVRTLLTSTTPRTGGLAGGGYFINNAVSLSANLSAGTTTCLTFLSAAPNTCTLVGNITGSATTAAARAVTNSSSGTVNIFGTVRGPAIENALTVSNDSSGVINISGDIFSNIGNQTRSCINRSSGTINITGNLIGSANAGNGAVPAANAGSGLVTIVGNLSAFGARGCFSSLGTGTTNITGNLIGSTTGAGASLTFFSTGTVNILGTVRSSSGWGIFIDSTAGRGTINVIGSVLSVGAVQGIRNDGSATVNITGDLVVQPGGTQPVANQSFGIINVVGNVSSNGNANGIRNTGPGTINVIGNVTGSNNNDVFGINNSSTGTVTIRGNVTGGTGNRSHGVGTSTAGYILIQGNVIGGTGSTAHGAANFGTGYLEVQGLAVGNAFGLGSAGINSAPGIFGSQTGTTIIRGLSCGPRGQWPTAGNVFIIPQNTSTATLFTSASAAQVLFTSLSTNIVPPASSVRQGTVYNLNQSTGTCAIPSISSVLQGVSVDNSIGIAALQPQTIWNYLVLSATDVDSLGGRLKEVATVQSVGYRLTALN